MTDEPTDLGTAIGIAVGDAVLGMMHPLSILIALLIKKEVITTDELEGALQTLSEKPEFKAEPVARRIVVEQLLKELRAGVFGPVNS